MTAKNPPAFVDRYTERLRLPTSPHCSHCGREDVLHLADVEKKGKCDR